MLLYANDSVTEVNALVPKEGEVGWIHLPSPTADEVTRIARDLFHCHPLAVEDMIHFGQRAKVDTYQDAEHHHAFIVFYSIGKQLATREFCIAVDKRFVITVAQDQLPWLDALYETVKQKPELMSHTGMLVHRILDHCVDGYVSILDTMEGRVDELEQQVFDHPERNLAPSIFKLKRKLHRARRVAKEGRDVIGMLVRDEFPYTEEGHQAYFMDIYDHVSRAVDSLDLVREGLSSLLDLQTAQRANRMNEVMKTLAIISTIFLPLSFIAGVYGMNFHDIPELSWTYGYPYAIALMVSIAGALLIYFKRRGWW